MNYWCRILLEATIVAISIVSLGFVIKKFTQIKDPLMLLFVTGFLTHLIYDLVGFNKYYCKICAGCK
tara:strand:+ start:372 stop:572 length:201 start_codon:yes stop_codon:yes gene_type:complete